MSVTVRFAPSPTGHLHLGNARVALVNWLFAHRAGGRFLLRLDDTDAARSTRAYAAAIEADLRWLGLGWDQCARQSARAARYREALDALAAAGRAYPCYETPEELEAKRRRQRARGRPPIYDRAAFALSAEERRALEAEGRVPHWRFRLDASPIAWDDLIHGPWRFEAEKLGDPVLVRADGRPLFLLSSSVDDLDFAISHVIRGEDHVATTAAQVQLAAALGGAPPAFAHLPLLSDAAGRGLSKRLGSLSLAALREDGIEAMAINAYLARIGTPDPIEPAPDLEALAAAFAIERLGRAAPKFDLAELTQLSARHLHGLAYQVVAARLAAMGLDAADHAFWDAVRPNLHRLEDARAWYAVCRGRVAPVLEDAEFARAAAAMLPGGAWDERTWAAWTGALKARTGRTGRALFRPLRLALTGREHGPELKNLLPLIGPERARARLGGETA